MKVTNPTSAKVIIIISANTEWRALRAILPTAKPSVSPLGDWFTTAIQGGRFTHIASDTYNSPVPEIIFFHGGWGKIAAAASTQYTIDRWQPELLVNLGTCGGFEGLVERGSIILVEKTIVYDIIEQMGDFDEHVAHYTTEINLSWLTDEYPQEVLRTLLISGDRDLLAEDLPELHARYGAIAGDWEAGAIAYVAAQNNVRTLILRGVTDLVSASGGEAYGNLQLFEKATSGIMQRLIDALPAWLQIAGVL